MRQSPVVLDLCVRKTWTGKSNDNHGRIIFEELRFRIVSCPHRNEKPAFSNFCGWKSVFQKPCFRDGLVWIESVTGAIKLCFQILPA